MKFLNKPSAAFILISVASLIWGATAPIMKLTLEVVPTFSLAFTRMAFASLILSVFVFKNCQIKKEDTLHIIFASLTGVTFNLTLFFIGLQYTDAISSSFLGASVPILTILAAHVFLKEKLTLRLVFSSVIALIGVVVIIGKPQHDASIGQIIGNILILLSSLSWVAHEVFAKKLAAKYSGGALTFFYMSIGALTFLPLSLWETIKNPNWVENINLKASIGIIYGIFFASLLAYWSWQKALSKIKASEASFFFYLNPISGAVFSIILLGERITTPLLIGGVLITIGVVLAEAHRKNHPLHRTK